MLSKNNIYLAFLFPFFPFFVWSIWSVLLNFLPPPHPPELPDFICSWHEDDDDNGKKMTKVGVWHDGASGSAIIICFFFLPLFCPCSPPPPPLGLSSWIFFPNNCQTAYVCGMMMTMTVIIRQQKLAYDTTGSVVLQPSVLWLWCWSITFCCFVMLSFLFHVMYDYCSLIIFRHRIVWTTG